MEHHNFNNDFISSHPILSLLISWLFLGVSIGLEFLQSHPFKFINIDSIDGAVRLMLHIVQFFSLCFSLFVTYYTFKKVKNKHEKRIVFSVSVKKLLVFLLCVIVSIIAVTWFYFNTISTNQVELDLIKNKLKERSYQFDSISRVVLIIEERDKQKNKLIDSLNNRILLLDKEKEKLVQQIENKKKEYEVKRIDNRNLPFKDKLTFLANRISK